MSETEGLQIEPKGWNSESESREDENTEIMVYGEWIPQWLMIKLIYSVRLENDSDNSGTR